MHRTCTHVVTIAALTGLSFLGACEKKKAPPPPAPVVDVPPPPPPAPEAVTLDTLMQSEKADARVQFPQEVAPVDESLARAIIQFTSALAKGNGSAFKPMLSTTAQSTFDGLSASGEWEESTRKIAGVRVLRIIDNAPTGEQSMTDATVYLGVQEAGSAYVLGWGALKQGTGWKFAGTASTTATRARASDFEKLSDADLEGKTSLTSVVGSIGATAPESTALAAAPAVNAETAPAPKVEKPEPQIARESGEANVPRPLQLWIHSQTAMRVLARGPQGAPLEAEVVNGLARKYKIDGTQIAAFLDRGSEDAAESRKLPNRELYLWVQDAMKTWKSNTSVETTPEELVRSVSQITKRSFEDVLAEYEAGEKEKK
jgi:hypothetical protein